MREADIIAHLAESSAPVSLVVRNISDERFTSGIKASNRVYVVKAEDSTFNAVTSNGDVIFYDLAGAKPILVNSNGRAAIVGSNGQAIYTLSFYGYEEPLASCSTMEKQLVSLFLDVFDDAKEGTSELGAFNRVVETFVKLWKPQR